jgi:hypothetical protein
MRLSSESHARSTPDGSTDSALSGHRPELFTGQRGSILSLLLQNRGKWIPSYRLSAIALQYGARVKELRDAGYTIENRTQRADGQVHGSFCLVACPGEGEPQ